MSEARSRGKKRENLTLGKEKSAKPSPPKRKKVKSDEGKTKSNKDEVSVNGDEVDMNIVLRLPNVMRAKVVSRPSKVVKSPYMADIIVDGEQQTFDIFAMSGKL